MVSIVGTFTLVENDYRRERISGSWSRGPRRTRRARRQAGTASRATAGTPCAA
jgi:hypothetical protein